MRNVRWFLSLLAAGLLIAACGSGGPEGPTDRGDGEGVVTLSITPDALANANVDEEYSFLLSARGVPEDVRFVTFGWSFGGTLEHKAVAVRNGTATHAFKRSFAAVGEYELEALVGRATGRNIDDYDVLASASLDITVGDGQPGAAELTVSPSFITNGEIGRAYTFDFDATAIPEGLGAVTFSWGLAGGEWERAEVPVAGGAASSGATFTFDRAGTYRLDVLLSEPYADEDVEDIELLASSAVSIVIGSGAGGPAESAKLVIDPGSITDGRVGESYSFTLRASEIPGDLTEVIFAWQFEGQAMDYARVPVVDGAASHEAVRTYHSSGTFWLRGYVGRSTHATDASQYSALGSSIATISIESEAPDRDVELGSCDGWVETQSGAHGVTVDHWDLSGVPVGAVIDFRYDTIRIPDSFTIEYPDGNIVHQTGWVGSSTYNRPRHRDLYPEGVVGGPRGTAEGIFTRLAGQDEFKVTVLGPDRNTLWSYEIRCHVPD